MNIIVIIWVVIGVLGFCWIIWCTQIFSKKEGLGISKDFFMAEYEAAIEIRDDLNKGNFEDFKDGTCSLCDKNFKKGIKYKEDTFCSKECILETITNKLLLYVDIL